MYSFRRYGAVPSSVDSSTSVSPSSLFFYSFLSAFALVELGSCVQTSILLVVFD